MTAKKPYIPDPDEFVTYARRDEDPTQQWLCDPRNDPDSIFYVPPPPVSESRVVVDPAKQYRPSPAVRARLSLHVPDALRAADTFDPTEPSWLRRLCRADPRAIRLLQEPAPTPQRRRWERPLFLLVAVNALTLTQLMGPKWMAGPVLLVALGVRFLIFLRENRKDATT